MEQSPDANWNIISNGLNGTTTLKESNKHTYGNITK